MLGLVQMVQWLASALLGTVLVQNEAMDLKLQAPLAKLGFLMVHLLGVALLSYAVPGRASLLLYVVLLHHKMMSGTLPQQVDFAKVSSLHLLLTAWEPFCILLGVHEFVKLYYLLYQWMLMLLCLLLTLALGRLALPLAQRHLCHLAQQLLPKLQHQQLWL